MALWESMIIVYLWLTGFTALTILISYIGSCLKGCRGNKKYYNTIRINTCVNNLRDKQEATNNEILLIESVMYFISESKSVDTGCSFLTRAKINHTAENLFLALPDRQIHYDNMYINITVDVRNRTNMSMNICSELSSVSEMR